MICYIDTDIEVFHLRPLMLVELIQRSVERGWVRYAPLSSGCIQPRVQCGCAGKLVSKWEDF